jgi:tRNA(Arg) A34 adenosine deaminase TadA
MGLGGIAGLLIPFRMHAGSGNTFQSSVDIEQILQPDDRLFIERAFEMRDLAVETGDQAYGALVVRNNQIIGQSPSHVVVHGDPTAHAEMEAIRDAARRTGSRDLSGSILYSSSPACPMCEAAAYWANINNMIYGSQASDGGRPELC